MCSAYLTSKLVNRLAVATSTTRNSEVLIKTYHYSVPLMAKSPLDIERRSRIYTKNCTDHFLRTFNNNNNNNNNNNDSMFKQDDHFSFKNCYQYGS